MSDVFISYSRKDIAFAKLLHQALKENDLETWIDWQDIPPSADWLAEIYEAIEQANTFVFIISETSLDSEVCGYEIAHSSKHHKRLIPIVISDIEAGKVPKELAVLNWIFFEETGEKFTGAVHDLVTAITVDQAWLKAHTRYENRALEWEKKDQESGTLLRGGDLTEAETWLARSAGKDPQPTALQTHYILASRSASTRRQRLTLIGVASGLVIAIGLGILAWTQRNVAISEGNARATAQMEAIGQRNAAVAEGNARATAQSEAVAESHMRATAQVEAQTETYARATQQAIAEEQRDIAIKGLSRRIGVEAAGLVNESQSLSLLLSLEALHLADTVEARSSLLAGITEIRYLEKILFNNKSSAYCVEFSPDGNFLATCHQKNTELSPVLLWDSKTGQVIGGAGLPGSGSNAVVFSQDGKSLAILSSSEHTMVLWDLVAGVVKGDPISFQTDLDLNSKSIAFHPSEGYFAVVSAEGRVRFYDSTNQTLLDELYTDEVPDVSSLAFSPDGKQLAVGSLHGPIVLWELDDLEKPAIILAGTEGAYLLSFIPDGSQLGYVSKLDVDWKDSTWYGYDLTLNVIVEYGHCNCIVDDLDFSFDGKFLAPAQDGGLRLYYLDNPPHSNSLRGFRTFQNLTGISFSPDGRVAATSNPYDYDRNPNATALIWTLESEYPIHNSHFGSGSINNLAFIPPNGDTLVSTFSQSNKIQFWDTEKSILSEEKETISGVQDLAISKDGKIMALAFVRSIQLWAIESGQPLTEPVPSIQGCVKSMVFNQGGDLFTGGCDGSIRMWSGKDLSSISFNLDHPSSEAEDPIVEWLEISTDERFLVSLSAENLAVWDLQVDDPIPEVLDTPGDDPRFEKYYGSWNHVIFHPDGTLLAADRKGGAIDFWELPNLTWMEQVMDPGQDRIDQIAFSADGHWMASGHSGWVNLWDVQTRQHVGQSFGRGDAFKSPTLLAFNPQKNVLAAKTRDGIHFWSLDLEMWQATACKIANRNLTPEEWKTHLGDLPYRSTCPQYETGNNP